MGKSPLLTVGVDCLGVPMVMPPMAMGPIAALSVVGLPPFNVPASPSAPVPHILWLRDGHETSGGGCFRSCAGFEVGLFLCALLIKPPLMLLPRSSSQFA